MRTVFVGGPFKALIDSDTGVIPERSRARFLTIIEFFEGKGWAVLSGHREEEWGATVATSDVCTGRDWRWMHQCDLFVAFPGDPVSPGTHVELGWASALGRPVIVVTDPGQRVADLVLGLGEVTDVQYLEWCEPTVLKDLAKLVDAAPVVERGSS
ncbi:nucleoside 2-deoxyribosyltransferase [Streptomyces sp. NPDC050658]|uniref:nucleoside 2-deoxyribosyltransferase n=1 Tax=unclassified Streptomyces TaxID=2593676 RepID=UPI00341BECE9